MAIEFSSVTNGISNYLYTSSFLNCTLTNVLYTSIILSIILLIIVLFVYTDAQESSVFKLFLHMFIVNTVVLAAHQSVLAIKYKENNIDAATSDIMTNINRKGGNVIYDDENVKVTPKFKDMDISDLNKDTYESKYQTNESYEEQQPEINNATTATELLDELERSS